MADASAWQEPKHISSEESPASRLLATWCSPMAHPRAGTVIGPTGTLFCHSPWRAPWLRSPGSHHLCQPSGKYLSCTGEPQNLLLHHCLCGISAIDCAKCATLLPGHAKGSLQACVVLRSDCQHEQKLCFNFLICAEGFFSSTQVCPGSVYDCLISASRLR